MDTTAFGGKGSKGRAANGDQPIGATSCRREQHTKATCQTPRSMVEDSLLKRQTRTYTRRYQPAYSLSFYGTPPTPAPAPPSPPGGQKFEWFFVANLWRLGPSHFLGGDVADAPPPPPPLC